jgi:multidrug efflux pump subunit AcrB
VEVERFLEKNIPAKERKMIISELGLVPDWSAAYTANSGSQDAVIKVQLTDERTRSAQEYAVLLRDQFLKQDRFSDLNVSFDTGGMVSAALNYGASSPVDIQIEGGTLEQAHGLAQKIWREVKDIRGTADVRIRQRLDAPLRKIVVDRKKAADVGLSEYNVINQVVTAMNSSVAVNRNFWIDNVTGNQYFVAVQYHEEPGLKLEDVLNISATSARQDYPVKLSSLVQIEPGEAPVEVNHANLARVFNVLVNTKGRDIGSLARDIQKKVDNLKIPAGMHVNLKGEYSRMTRSFGDLGLGLVMAAILVYLLLVALFRSYLGPFIIMFAVPLGLIGVLAMLYLTKTTLNVQSSMGVIFMVGIVVSNSVLLVDFANKQRKLGATVHQAITTAAAVRFRPIMMTFLATFLDLLPMAIGLGRGGEANVPLARSVVGGLLTSTFLTLIVVPIMYSLLNRDTAEPEADIDAILAGTVEG